MMAGRDLSAELFDAPTKGRDLSSELFGNAQTVEPITRTQKVNAVIDSLQRQIGLTARYGIEGLGNTAQIFSEPIRYVTDRIAGSVGKSKPAGVLATELADALGLPSPATPTERTIGDATRLLAGSGGTMAAGQLLQRSAAPVAKAIGEFFTQAPVQQLSGAAGAGLLGGASREAGGDATAQTIAALAGGVGGAGLAGSAQSLAKRNAMMTPKQMDVKLSSVLAKADVDYSKVPEAARASLRAELGNALKAEQELDPAAVARLLDFKQTGLTPTRGYVTLNPVQITREKNLAKMAANSSDGKLHGLPMIENRNNAKLIENLNTLGASNGNLLDAGRAVTGSVLGTQSALRGAEKAAWEQTKTLPGYKQPISSAVLSDVNAALDDEALMPFMNRTISRYMEAFQTGQPFTPQAYRNLQSMLSREVARGGNEGAAASLASRILLDAELKPAGFSTTGGELVSGAMASGMRNADTNALDAIGAINAARRATKAAYEYEASSPLVRSILSNGASSDPQRIAQRFVIGGTADEARELAMQLGPNGSQQVKNAILLHLKEKALGNASDEVGNFSQSAFNKALKSIGSKKLELFFAPEEINQLRALGRVASYTQVQPKGSAVNNSNTAAMLFGRGLDALSNVPVVGPLLVPPVKNLQVTIGNRSAQNVMPGLLVPVPAPPLVNRIAAPSLAFGGLLSAPMVNQQ